jgi:hypothetical protein
MNVNQWFYISADERRGPFTFELLVTELLRLREPQKVLVWHAALPSWTQAGALADFVGALPPPIPNRPSDEPPTLSRILPLPPNAPPVRQHEVRNQRAPTLGAKGSREYTRVGGWLAVFCVGLLALSPLMTLVNLSSMTDLNQHYDTVAGLRAFIFADVVAGISLVTLGVAAGVQLLRIKPNAVRLASIYLACFFAYAVFETVAPFVFGLPAEWTTEMVKDGPKEIGRAGIYVAIWATYFRKSKRVAATYGHLHSDVPPRRRG